MSNLREEIKGGAEWAVKAFEALGHDLDYSIQSVEHIENLLEEQFKDGLAYPGGLFSDDLGNKMFSLSSYIGEVIIRNTKGTDWEFDPKDPDNDFLMMVSTKTGAKVWPQQKLLKRVQHGSGDNVYFYTRVVVKKFNESNEEDAQTLSPNSTRNDQTPSTNQKPWWKFW